MSEILTTEELTKRIRLERRIQEKSMDVVGEAMGVTKQRVLQAEKPDKTGIKLNELRMSILSYLLNKSVMGPVFIIGEDE